MNSAGNKTQVQVQVLEINGEVNPISGLRCDVRRTVMVDCATAKQAKLVAAWANAKIRVEALDSATVIAAIESAAKAEKVSREYRAAERHNR